MSRFFKMIFDGGREDKLSKYRHNFAKDRSNTLISLFV